MNRVLAENFRRITLKLRPGWDLQIVSAARSELPPRVKLQIDIEGALDSDMHSEIFYRLEDFFLTLIEQPLAPDDIVSLLMLQSTIRTPICLDESINSLLKAKIAIDIMAENQTPIYFCIKPDRLAGLGCAKEVVELAQSNKIGCYGGCNLQSPLGYRHLLALASQDNFILPCDWFRFDELFAELPVPVIAPTLHEEEIPNNNTDTDGTDTEEPKEKDKFQAIELWDDPGIGVEPDRNIFDKYIVDSVTFERT